MRRHLEDLVVPPSLRRPERYIPDALDRAVLRALAKAPAHRYPSVITFANALRSALPMSRPAAARISRVDDSARPETPTRTNERPRPRMDEVYLAEVRRTTGEAIMCGDRRRTAAGYLRIARALAADTRLAEALIELDEGIELLARGPEVDRLRAVRATFYVRARTSSDDHPTELAL